MTITDHFENVKDFAWNAAEVAAGKARQFSEITKTNMAIKTQENRIRKAQLELGKLYYRDYIVDDGRNDAEYLAWCRKIDEAKRTIAQLQDYLSMVRNRL